jgi:hypothetical protein
MRLTLHPRNLLVVTLALGLAALLGEGVCPRTAWGQDELFVANATSLRGLPSSAPSWCTAARRAETSPLPELPRGFRLVRC